MSRKLLKINELKIVYLKCSNPEKENIISNAINSINALTIIPEVKNE